MEGTEVADGAKIFGLTLFLEGEKTLVFSDAHLGYEEYLNKQGIMVPKFQYNGVAAQVREALEETKPEKVVVDGDLKHEFGRISEQEWKEVLKFLDLLEGHEVVLVKGNHDNVLGPIAGRKNVTVTDEYKAGKFLIIHGNRIPDKKSLEGVETIVIGHEHPAVGLREEGRVEKMKCFLVGEWRGKRLIVLPSLNQVTEGTDLLKEKPLSPLLDDVGDFKAYCIEDGEVLYFGRISELPVE